MKIFPDISTVVENNLCFSCGACLPVCQPDSISFHFTPAGRLHPRVDFDTCTHCGVCFAVCPGLDPKNRVLGNLDTDPFEGPVVNAYVGRTLNQKVYRNSQSGGVVTEVLSYLFAENLITHALLVKSEFSLRPRHSCYLAQNIDEATLAQKSKYIPLDILSALQNIKEIKGDIAVVGLPCQIEGVVSLQKQNPRQFGKIKYKLGLICDGVLSNLASEYFVQGVIGEHRIIYKNKDIPSYIHANVTVQRKDNPKDIVISSRERFLLKELTTPPRCHACFDKMNFHADLVFGDPWGVEGYDQQHGDSIVVSRNTLGQGIIDALLRQTRASLEKIDYDIVLKGQRIDLKRAKVFETYSAYKKLGFVVPSYVEALKMYAKKPTTWNAKKTLEKFLSLEQKTNEQNLRFISARLRTIKTKDRVKGLLKKIFLTKYWYKK